MLTIAICDDDENVRNDMDCLIHEYGYLKNLTVNNRVVDKSLNHA